MRSLRLLTLLAFLSAWMFSLNTARAADEKVLHIIYSQDMRTSDPHIAYETETWPTASLFYIGLVKMKDASTPEPALAASWKISDDGTTYTFTLRDGIKFSNGRAITTDDVKYSFMRLLNPKTASPTAFMFTPLIGVEEYQAGTATDVPGIKIIDKKTIEFKTKTPVWSMMQRFALPPGFIVAKEGVEAAGEEFARKPLGAGPYMIDSWQSGVMIKGTKNPYYFEQGKPAFDRFEMQLGVEDSVGTLKLENGEADIALNFVSNGEYPRLSADPTLSKRLLRLEANPNVDYVILNVNKAPFDKLDVRKALNMAIDRQRLTQITNGRSVPIGGFLPPNVPGSNPDVKAPPYDVDGAKKLLASAGFPDGFSTKLVSNNDPTDVSLSQAVISDLGAIGVKVEYTQMDEAQFLDYLNNKPAELDMVTTEWYMDYVDPSDNYEPLLKCGGSYNWAKFCDKELDALFEKANLTPLGDARWKAFADFEAKVAERIPNLFLEHRDNYYFLSARLNIQSDPGYLLKFADATVK
jgi:ABC-type transport system substrate-binding protein